MDGYKNTTRMKTMIDGVSARPRTASGREASNRDLGLPERRSTHPDTKGMTPTEIRKMGEAIARGNRTPYEPIPPKNMKSGGLAVMPKRGKKC